MKVHAIEQEQWLPLTLKEGWDFFSSPRNLEEMTPPELGFRIVSLPSETLYEGEIIEYAVKAFPGIWIPWISEITSLKEGESFVDDQISGPFRFWHHRHSFEEKDGGVLVRDHIHYAVGFWFFGEIARHLVVKGQLEKMFEHRRVTLEKKFGKAI